MALRTLDFRSDTVTQPTPEMRKAMAEAEVGDDVYGEDPTVNRLEEAAAKKVGAEAALFVPTGTMGNEIAVWVHSGRRGQAIVEENCHIALYEGGGPALLSNVTLRTVQGRRGVFGPAEIQRHFHPKDPHFAETRLVAIENSHNHSGGCVWSVAETRALREEVQAKEARFHVDGARIFNAAVAQRTTAAKLCKDADSVMFCLSKGLSAPVGSLVCGSEAFVREARSARKVLGGGMRQAGHLAAAGLVALTLVDRLADDHANAAALARGLSALPRLKVEAPATNMVLADVSATGMPATAFCDVMKEAGVLCLPRDSGMHVRFVTHRGVLREDVKQAVERVGRVLRED